MVEHDDEIKVLGEINLDLQSGPHKLIEKLSQEKDSPDDFYGFIYETHDDASISGKSCEHFGWDWPEKDSPGTEVVVVQNNVQQQVAGEVVFYPPVHEDVAKECLDDEHVEERRPSKRIRVTQ
ncbi:hypothetical protein Tco_0658890 [Tanacetum coccineum]